MSKIFSHLSPEFQTTQMPNGALLYSQEIVKYFIPAIKTKRNWVTIRKVPFAYDHCIYFVHNNLNADKGWYDWLSNYKDVVLVCGVPETCEKLKHLGKTIYLPLSVCVKDVEKWKTKKTKDTCYAGRKGKFASCNVLYSTPRVENLEHEEFLQEMAKYKKVYAVGRCAIEAKILGCKVLPYDPRYPDPSVWKVVDTSEAIKILQDELDKIDDKNYKPKIPPTIDTNNPNYVKKRAKLGAGQFNGAYYYSQEIVKNIIPNVKTDRPWDTLGMKDVGTYDHAIVFIHHNIEMDRVYSWLKDYNDLVLVTSSPYTQEWAEKAGYKAVYVPLSIDTEYVKKFKKRKTKDTCFCGNIWSFRKDEIAKTIPEGVDFQPKDVCREDLLRFMATYKKVYAIGRCALEAKCLGAEILQCYKKFPVEHWKLMDNKEAAKILQEGLDKIDGRK